MQLSYNSVTSTSKTNFLDSVCWNLLTNFKTCNVNNARDLSENNLTSVLSWAHVKAPAIVNSLRRLKCDNFLKTYRFSQDIPEPKLFPRSCSIGQGSGALSRLKEFFKKQDAIEYNDLLTSLFDKKISEVYLNKFLSAFSLSVRKVAGKKIVFANKFSFMDLTDWAVQKIYLDYHPKAGAWQLNAFTLSKELAQEEGEARDKAFLLYVSALERMTRDGRLKRDYSQNGLTFYSKGERFED